MVLNEEMNELGRNELENALYTYLTGFFNCNINYDNLFKEIINLAEAKDEIGDDEKFKKFLKALFKDSMRIQDKRQNNVHQMISECLDKGESRKFTLMKTRNADYILELNLIESNDIKAEDYYKNEDEDE